MANDIFESPVNGGGVRPPWERQSMPQDKETNVRFKRIKSNDGDNRNNEGEPSDPHGEGPYVSNIERALLYIDSQISSSKNTLDANGKITKLFSRGPIGSFAMGITGLIPFKEFLGSRRGLLGKLGNVRAQIGDNTRAIENLRKWSKMREVVFDRYKKEPYAYIGFELDVSQDFGQKAQTNMLARLKTHAKKAAKNPNEKFPEIRSWAEERAYIKGVPGAEKLRQEAAKANASGSGNSGQRRRLRHALADQLHREDQLDQTDPTTAAPQITQNKPGPRTHNANFRNHGPKPFG